MVRPAGVLILCDLPHSPGLGSPLQPRVSQPQRPDSAVSLDTLLHHGDLNQPQHQGPGLWPVLLTLPLALLHQVGDHHHHPHPLLPDQSPELRHRPRQRALKWKYVKYFPRKTLFVFIDSFIILGKQTLKL